MGVTPLVPPTEDKVTLRESVSPISLFPCSPLLGDGAKIAFLGKMFGKLHVAGVFSLLNPLFPGPGEFSP